jgi:serine/threonine protein kinase
MAATDPNASSDFAPPICPRCGALIPAGIDHVCEARTPQDPALESLSPELRDLSRVAPCPFCSKTLEVSAFDPLELIECSYCRKSFELLKKFGNYILEKSYDTGWHNAVYAGQSILNGQKVILKVLSSHVLAQPDSLALFLKEIEGLQSRATPQIVTEMKLNQINGFLHLAIGLQRGVAADQALEALGININVEPIVQVNVLGPSTVEREQSCPNCKKGVSVSHHDPLDEINCPHCNRAFEVLRSFGHYRLDYKLSAGGTSILYLALDTETKKKIAIKVLKSTHMRRQPESIEDFLKEVELTRKLVHPNVIQVYDGGEYHGFYFMVLELVEGLTLSDILDIIQTAEAEKDPKGRSNVGYTDEKQERFRPALPELVGLEIVLQAASGLGSAHAQNLVHGDVKPENIMLTFEGVVKVLDFGLVQFANSEKLVGEGHSIFGTPLYIPPERVRGEPEDFSSDFYSLGATLYHLLRGIEPYRAKTIEDLVLMHTNYPLLSFKAFVPWVSDTTCRIVEKSMKKSLEGRYKSHIEFIADITLAKSLLLQTMNQKPKDGRAILKEYIMKLPSRKGSGLWKKARTSMISTYKYATRAITGRFQTFNKKP